MGEILHSSIGTDNIVVSHMHEAEQLFEPHTVAESIAGLSRETDKGRYVEKLLAIDAELHPVEGLLWSRSERTQSNIANMFAIAEHALNRRIKVLRSGYYLLSSSSEDNPFEFTKHHLPAEYLTRYRHKKANILPSDQSVRLLILDLLSWGHRSTELKNHAIHAWEDKTSDVISILYEYQTIHEYFTKMGFAENTTLRRLHKHFPSWKETFPIKYASSNNSIFLSPQIMRSLTDIMSQRKRYNVRRKDLQPPSQFNQHETNIHQKADSIALLSREKNNVKYTRNLIAIDKALEPVEKLDLDIPQRTRNAMSVLFEMHDEALKRRVRFLRTEYKKAFPYSESNPFEFTDHTISLENHSRFSKRNIHVLLSDQGIRVLMLDLLSRGYRSDGLKTKALHAWQNEAKSIIHALYEYKTIEEYTTEMHRGYNTTIKRLNKLFTDWRETFPIKHAYGFQAVLLSPKVMTYLNDSMRPIGHPKSTGSSVFEKKQNVKIKNKKIPIHIKIGTKFVKRYNLTLTSENVIRTQEKLKEETGTVFMLPTIYAIFALAHKKRKKNTHPDTFIS